jgi:CDP-paratose 2-epimerase
MGDDMNERILITGGRVFHRSTSSRELDAGKTVDSTTFRVADLNAEWLGRLHPTSRLRVVRADIRQDRDLLQKEVDGADVVFHLAAQVAVTLSVSDPRHDFEVNALGTFNVLDAARRRATPPVIVYASTNKVYGKMADVVTEQRGARYVYRDMRESRRFCR